MTDIRRLGTTDHLVDFTSYPYRVVEGSETDESPTYDVLENPVRGAGLINLAVAAPVAVDFGFDVVVYGTSWQDVLDNIDKVKVIIGTRTSLAEQHSIRQTGEQVTYSEAGGDQITPTVWNVKRGEVREHRSRRQQTRPYTFINVKLHCEPDPV